MYSSLTLGFVLITYLLLHFSSSAYSIETVYPSFISAQGNENLALVPKQLMQKYELLFNEHEVYEIGTFNVIKSDDNYQGRRQELRSPWSIKT